MQVIGEQVVVGILDLSKVSYSGWWCFYTSGGLGLKMVKDLDM